MLYAFTGKFFPAFRGISYLPSGNGPDAIERRPVGGGPEAHGGQAEAARAQGGGHRPNSAVMAFFYFGWRGNGRDDETSNQLRCQRKL